MAQHPLHQFALSGITADPRFLIGKESLRQFLKNYENPSTPYRTPLPAVRSRSHGIVHRVRGVTTGRIHHLQSRFEYWVLLVLDMCGRFKNILEGFPLPILLTQAIADEKIFTHPRDWRRRQDVTMTVDFLALDLQERWLAFDFKQAKELKKGSVRKKLEITTTALGSVDIQHHVVTEHDLPAVPLKNFRLLHRFAGPFGGPLLALQDVAKVEIDVRAILIASPTTRSRSHIASHFPLLVTVARL